MKSHILICDRCAIPFYQEARLPAESTLRAIVDGKAVRDVGPWRVSIQVWRCHRSGTADPEPDMRPDLCWPCLEAVLAGQAWPAQAAASARQSAGEPPEG